MIQLFLWTLVLFSTAAGGNPTVNSPIVTVEVHDAHDGFPSMLLGSSGAVSSQAGSSHAVEYLVNSTSEGHAKRHRQYVTPVGYNESENGSLAESLNLPRERGGLQLSRWVICSWVVANISAADAVRNKDNVFLERIPELLRSVQNLAPSQVYAVAAANISLGFTITGVPTGSITPAAQNALGQAASEMAGGYSTHLIKVSTSPPDQATGGSQVDFQGSVQDTSLPPADIVKRGKDLGATLAAAAAPAGSAGTGRRRRLTGVQQQPYGARHLVNVWGGSAGAAAVLPRRLLQAPQAAAAPPPAAAPAAAPTTAATTSGAASVPIWLTYKHVAPANTTTLLLELCHSCNVTPTVAVGFDFAPQPCGKEVKAALVAAGVEIEEDAYSQVLVVPPSVSLSVRLAVGMTAAQVASGADVALAQWLAEPATAQAVARMYAPDAVIRWLHTPEIWFQKIAPQPAVSPGAAAGIAIAATVTVCAAVAAAVWFFHPAGRKRRQAAAAADKQDDANSSTSGRRRRRREGKRRYLLPDLLRPDSQPDTGGAGPSSSAVSPAPEEEDLNADDAELSRDQIRPQLRSLGDSVTSAVRFEQSDEEEEAEDGQAGPSAAPAGDLDSSRAGPSTSHTAAAAGVLAAAAGAAGAAATAAAASSSSTACTASSSRPAASSRSVLQARKVLLAELQQQDGCQQEAAASQHRPSSSRGAACGAAAAAWDVVPAAVSPELAAAADLSSAVSLSSRAQHSTSPSGVTAAAAATPAASSSAAASTEITPHLKPVDERAAAASAAAVAAAAALPQSGAVSASAQRKSPFAMSYDFGDLADAATPVTSPDPAAATAAMAAAMAAASAKAVALPPRPLPVSPTSNMPSCSSPPVSGFERKSSGGSVGGGSSLASGGNSSSSGAGSPSISAPAGTGSKGVGLQQLVSISPIRASTPLGVPGTGGDGTGVMQDGLSVLTNSNMVSNGSMCSSVYLQGGMDSCESGLLLSSSMSGPVLQPGTCTSQGTHAGSCSAGVSGPYSRQGGPVEVFPASGASEQQQ